MKKITLELSDADLGELVKIIKENASTSLLAKFEKSIGTTDDEAFIREKVCIAIDKVSILSLAEVTALAADPDTQSLKLDFRLGTESRRSLRPYFQQILLALKPDSDVKITNAACEALETFSSCIELIKGKL